MVIHKSRKDPKLLSQSTPDTLGAYWKKWGQQATVMVSLLALGTGDQVPAMAYQVANAATKVGSNAADDKSNPDALMTAVPSASLQKSIERTEAAPPSAGTPSLPRYGIPATVLESYRRAAESEQARNPKCNISWPLLAGIGKVESGHASNGNVNPDGQLKRPLYGPSLDGTNNTAAVRGAAGGWSRAEGPLQFLPSSWSKWGADGNGDGLKDLQNVYDSSLAAAGYLCSDGRDLRSASGLQSAILSYNNSADYVQLVLAWMKAYSNGADAIPDMPATRNIEMASEGFSHRSMASEPKESSQAPPPSSQQRQGPGESGQNSAPEPGQASPEPKPPQELPPRSLVAPVQKSVIDPARDTVGTMVKTIRNEPAPSGVGNILNPPK